MKLQPPDLEIGERDGFAKSDIFGLQDFGERFGTLVESLDSASVIVLDGPWGCGKSTFVRQWTGMLLQRGHAVINFDGFANDHHDDAFFALAGELYACGERNAVSRKKLLTSMVRSAKALWPLAARVTLKAVTQRMVSVDDIAKVKEAIVGSEDVSEQLILQKLTGVAEERRCIDALRKTLSEFAQEVTDPTMESGREDKPIDVAEKRKLVFVVDELDRCRPPFALSLLERIKHIFSVENVCFVLVAHLLELAKVVERNYGITDGDRYLEKFYQFRVPLPEPLQGRRGGRRETYVRHLVEAMNVESDDGRFLELTTDVLTGLGDAHELSLRTLQRITLNMSLVFRATNQRYLRLASIVGGLCVIRVVDDELYSRARRGQLSDEEAVAFMRLDDARAWDGRGSSSEWHRAWWVFATAEDGSDKLKDARVEAHARDLVRYNLERRRDIVPITCQYIDELHQRD